MSHWIGLATSNSCSWTRAWVRLSFAAYSRAMRIVSALSSSSLDAPERSGPQAARSKLRQQTTASHRLKRLCAQGMRNDVCWREEGFRGERDEQAASTECF